MPKVFISYRRDDSAGVTGRIDDRLVEVFGRERVFKDVDSIHLGRDFRESLSDAVGTCDALLVIIGERWLTAEDASGNHRLDNADDYVRIEVESALARDIPVVPVVLGKAQMPLREELPASMRELSFRNATRVRPDPDFTPDMSRLIAALEAGSMEEDEPMKFASRKNTIVFYAPTIQANPFFAELLDYAARKVNEKGFKFEIVTGNLQKYHKADNVLDVIRSYAHEDAVRNTAIVMIPPSSKTYDDIWKLDNELPVNLITLDMDIDENQEEAFERCNFHKAVIVADNKAGGNLAAQEVADFCSEEGITEINVVTCEGNMHGRGKTFLDRLERLGEKQNIAIHKLGHGRQLDFNDAVRRARDHVRDSFARSRPDLLARPTFVFCANDNMAIGARMALTNMIPTNVGVTGDELFQILAGTRIICFDASTFVRVHMDLEDEFLWRAVDQCHTTIVSKAIEWASKIFAGIPGGREKRVPVQPEIYYR